MRSVVLVGIESHQGNKHAGQVIRADQDIKVVVVSTLELLDKPLEHACPLVEHFKLRHQADGKGVLSRDQLVDGHLALDSQHVGLEVGDLHVRSALEGVSDAAKSLLEALIL